MNLERLLARCRAFEARAAAVYRTYASRTRHDPAICAMWTALAREEESHAQALGRAAGWLDPAQGWQTNLDGWQEDLDEIEARLASAEGPDVGADIDRQLVAALALERTELDTLFRRVLSLMPVAERPHGSEEHTAPLLAAADRRAASNPTVAFEAALLNARHRLPHAS